MIMKKPTKNIAALVWQLAEPVAASLNIIIWDVEYIKEGAEMILRITIDSDEGIDLDKCEKMHRAVEVVLDENDPIENSYRLEVSSPGIEREIKYDFHYDACIGEKVEVKLFAPIDETDNRKSISGILVAHDENTVSLADEADVAALDENSDDEIDVTVIEKSAISKVRTVFDFGEFN